MDSQTRWDYHVTLLSHHSSDNNLCDDNSSWLLLWYECVLYKNNIPVYGTRILLGPNWKRNTKKYILWTYSIPLSYPSCYIYGSFNFDSRSDIITPNHYFALINLDFFLISYYALSIDSSILFQKRNITRPSRHDCIYTTSILVLLFIVK